MFYREAGQFKSTYIGDQELFPVKQDRWGIFIIIGFSFIVVPLIANDYWLQAILIPFLIFSLSALGLNLLTGYAGQLSLGTGGVMAVGAYSCYKLVTYLPETNIIILILISGFFFCRHRYNFWNSIIKDQGFLSRSRYTCSPVFL